MTSLLRKFRQQARISCGELARRSKYDRSYICHLERGSIVAPDQARERLAEALGVPVSEIWPPNCCPICGKEEK